MADRILLIDDSSAVRALARMALERHGYTVEEAVDGEDAIGRLDGRALGAIVCDLAMPRVDGFGFLRYLRHHPRYSRVPVLLLSNETRPAMVERSKALGAQAFLYKPCRPSELVEAVQRLAH